MSFLIKKDAIKSPVKTLAGAEDIAIEKGSNTIDHWIIKSKILIVFCILTLWKAAPDNTEYRLYTVLYAYLLAFGVTTRMISYGNFFYAQPPAQGLGDYLSLYIETLAPKVKLADCLPAE